MKKTLFAVCLAAVAFLAASCQKELPKAVFTYEVEDFTVTFTNLSTNAISYNWNFGDGQTSTEANPVHIYAENGTYTVVLTATNADGEAQFTDEISLSAPLLKIDGNFADWDKLIADKNDLLVTTTLDPARETGRGSFYKMLSITDENFLYFMFTFKNDLTENMSFSFYIDADGDPTTGKDRSSYWYPSGAEYQIEFGDNQKADTDPDNATKYWNDWKYYGMYHFGDNAPGDVQVDNCMMSKVVEIEAGVAAVEFALPRAMFQHVALTNKSAYGVRFCNSTWDCSGQLPAKYADAEHPEAPVNFKFAE